MSLFYNPTIKTARPANSGGHVDGVKTVSPLKSKAVAARPTKGVTEKCSVIAREQQEWRRGAVIVRQRAVVGGQMNLFGRD